jgi:hypothetical protein
MAGTAKLSSQVALKLPVEPNLCELYFWQLHSTLSFMCTVWINNGTANNIACTLVSTVAKTRLH